MTEPDPTAADTAPALHDPYTDERYCVRSPQQIRLLLRSLIEKRAPVSACPEGNGRAFPTAVLELDGDTLLLDGSPLAAVNRQAERAAWLLCFTRLDKVAVRFRLLKVQHIIEQGRSALRAAIPEQIHHLQRRDFYRLETPAIDRPVCLVTLDPSSGPSAARVVDISASGIALLLPGDTAPLPLQKAFPGCELRLPGTAPIVLTLVVRNQRPHPQANGIALRRVGLRFEDLPRGADALIQRYIFRIERQRKARQSGGL